MSGYRKIVDVKAEIDGVERTFKLKAMTFEQSLTMSDAAAAIEGDAGSPEVKRKRLRAQGLVARRMLPDVCIGIEPVVNDADDAELAPADVIQSAYYSQAVMKVVTEWILQAVPSNPS